MSLIFEGNTYRIIKVIQNYKKKQFIALVVLQVLHSPGWEIHKMLHFRFIVFIQISENEATMTTTVRIHSFFNMEPNKLYFIKCLTSCKPRYGKLLFLQNFLDHVCLQKIDTCLNVEIIPLNTSLICFHYLAVRHVDNL